MPNLPVYRAILALLLATVLSSGCSSGNYAPVVDIYGGGQNSAPVTRGVHVVSAGETLYSIAWRYGWDFRALARANDIAQLAAIGTWRYSQGVYRFSPEMLQAHD